MPKTLIAALVSLSLLGPLACTSAGGGGVSETIPIGPTGGMVYGPDGVTLAVPSGAVDQSVEIRIKEASAASLSGLEWTALPSTVDQAAHTVTAHLMGFSFVQVGAGAVGGGEASPVYEITPHGQSFSEAVVLVVPYNQGEIPDGVDEAALTLYHAEALVETGPGSGSDAAASPDGGTAPSPDVGTPTEPDASIGPPPDPGTSHQEYCDGLRPIASCGPEFVPASGGMDLFKDESQYPAACQITSCTPCTCEQLGAQGGVWVDWCGGTVDCGPIEVDSDGCYEACLEHYYDRTPESPWYCDEFVTWNDYEFACQLPGFACYQESDSGGSNPVIVAPEAWEYDGLGELWCYPGCCRVETSESDICVYTSALKCMDYLVSMGTDLSELEWKSTWFMENFDGDCPCE